MQTTIKKRIRDFRQLRGVLGYSSAWKLCFSANSSELPVFVRELNRTVAIRPDTSDPIVLKQVFYERQYANLVDASTKFIVDCGANIGLSSLYFARHAPNATIVGLEPEPSNYAAFAKNVEHISRVQPIHAAVWHRRCNLSIANPSADKWAHSVSESQSTISVAAMTPAELVKMSPTGQIDLLKIDIEGAERELFSNGDLEWLSAVKRIVIELHDETNPGCAASFYRAITPRDFTQRQQAECVVINFESSARD